MIPDGRRQERRRGEVVWVEFPHMDRTRRRPELDEDYCKIFGRPCPDGHFVLVTEGKRRPMLIVAHAEPGEDREPNYRMLKLTTSGRCKHKPHYYRLGAALWGDSNRTQYVDCEKVHDLPSRLVVDGQKRVLDRERLVAVTQHLHSRMGLRPPPRRDSR